MTKTELQPGQLSIRSVSDFGKEDAQFQTTTRTTGSATIGLQPAFRLRSGRKHESSEDSAPGSHLKDVPAQSKPRSAPGGRHYVAGIEPTPLREVAFLLFGELRPPSQTRPAQNSAFFRDHQHRSPCSRRGVRSDGGEPHDSFGQCHSKLPPLLFSIDHSRLGLGPRTNRASTQPYRELRRRTHRA